MWMWISLAWEEVSIWTSSMAYGCPMAKTNLGFCTRHVLSLLLANAWQCGSWILALVSFLLCTQACMLMDPQIRFHASHILWQMILAHECHSRTSSRLTVVTK